MFVALALGRVGAEGKAGTAVLGGILVDFGEDALVREAAADSIARLGLDAEPATKHLVEALGNPQTEVVVRLAIVKALAKVQGETKLVWPALKVALGHNDSTLRVQSVRAAGPYGREEQEVIKVLAKMARNDENVEVRLAAIQELGLLEGAAKEAEPDLRHLFENDEREAVRQAAEVALKKIKGSP